MDPAPTKSGKVTKSELATKCADWGFPINCVSRRRVAWVGGSIRTPLSLTCL